MNLMPRQKNPFKNGTIQEVFETEDKYFTIVIANSFYEDEGRFTFTKAQAIKHYNIILTNILVTLKQGTERQKKAANTCLLNLHILPLRIH